MLQFLKENSLTSSMQALQDESQVALNTVDNVELFLGDVQNGRWDAVMSVVATLKLPSGFFDEIKYRERRALRPVRFRVLPRLANDAPQELRICLEALGDGNCSQVRRDLVGRHRATQYVRLEGLREEASEGEGVG